MKEICENNLVGSGIGYHTEIATQLMYAMNRQSAFTNDELKRMEVAYHAIIIDILKRVESIYKPEPKKYRVNFDTNTNHDIEVMAINEDDARKKVIEIVGKEGKSKVYSINLVKEVGGK